MNKESKKLSWAIGLVAGLGVLSIAYAALSSTLYIQGNGAVESSTVEFTACAPTVIGTNDVSYNESAGIAAGLTTAAMGGGTTGFAWDSNEAKAFGQAAGNASAAEVHRDAESSLSGDGIEIFRSNKKTNHYADSLLIRGTKLYDYGSYVIYKATLVNKGKNAMKLAQAPTVKAYFTPAGGTEQPTADANVTVTVHDSQANAIAGGSTGVVAAWSSGTTDSVNYLTANGTTDWYIRVARKTASDASGSADARLVDGTFRFTVDLTENATGSGPAFWTTAETTT